MNYTESKTLTRDCAAILIPMGTHTVLPKGSNVTITQSLGGSYTVMADGYLARIDAKDGDALGYDTSKKESAALPTGPVDEKAVWDAMKQCYDPEIPVNVVDLGLIYDCKIQPIDEGGNKVDVKMTLTAPGCGMGGVIAGDVEQRIRDVPGVTDVHVEVVWDPIWNQSMMSDAARLQLGLM